ncbi:MAG: arginase family protein, partial [Chloroflexota bacterium]|nr:arginase family protein [Chloroflexota bacterium]
MRQELFFPPRNFGAIPRQYDDLETSRVVVLPVPYDSTTTYRAGARDGPQAIIDASQYLELYDQELRQEIYRVGIHTLPEVEPLMSSPQDTIQRVYQVVKDLAERDKVVTLLGGEHSLTLGAVRAFKERFPDLSVLALDAHAD